MSYEIKSITPQMISSRKMQNSPFRHTFVSFIRATKKHKLIDLSTNNLTFINLCIIIDTHYLGD